MPSHKNQADIRDAVRDHVNGGSYDLGFTARSVAVNDKKYEDLTDLDVVVGIEGKVTERVSRAGYRSTVRVGIAIQQRLSLVDGAIPLQTADGFDALVKLADDIVERLHTVSGAAAILAFDAGRLVCSGIEMEIGDRDALREDSAFAAILVASFTTTT